MTDSESTSTPDEVPAASRSTSGSTGGTIVTVVSPSSMRDLQREAARGPELPRLQRTTVTAYLLAIAAGVLYGLFVFNPHNAGQTLPYVLLVLAEIILLGNQIVMILTILAGDQGSNATEDRRVVQEARRQLLAKTWTPSIDVFVPTYGEPLEAIARTARAARDMRIEHRTIICDDANDPEVRRLAERIGVEYLRRDGNVGAKAGNINNALRHSEAEYFAIFDADHVPSANFLEVLIPHFVDQRVAFVQSPQSYSNVDNSPVAEASHESQRVFYDLICPGKDAYNSVFSVGTNVGYRRLAIDDVGGLYQDTKSEDIWTSIRVHQRGWSSVYLPTVLAEGLAPETVHQFLTQQFRWSRGAFEVLFQGRPWRLRGLTRDQRIQYIQPALHYLQSFAVLFFMLLPPLFLVFYIQPLRVTGVGWLLRYAPFWLLTQLAVYYQLGRLHGWSYAMALASVPVHIRAFFSALFRRKYNWVVTNRAGVIPSTVSYMAVQIGMVAIYLTAFGIGLIPLSSSFPTVISLGLCLLYAFALFVVLRQAFRDGRRTPSQTRSRTTAAPVEA